MKRDGIGLQVSLDVGGRHAVIIGGGDVAVDKARRLLDAEAWVTVVSHSEVSDELRALARAGKLHLIEKEFAPSDVETADIVLVCLHDAALAQAVRAVVEGAAFWADDQPELSDLAMPALARLGRARIAVSTAGASPSLASKIRATLERSLGAEFGALVERLGQERERILRDEPDPEKRRAALIALVEGFELEIKVRYPRA